MVFEVDGGRLTDLFIDGWFGDETKDSKTVVGAVSGFGKGGFGAAAGLRSGRESVKKTLREEL